jgi:hypothetical protein
MKTILNEELKKFNLLTKYDSRLTLSENTQIINEQLKGFREFIELNAKEAKKTLENIGLKNFKTESGVVLKNTDEILDAMKKGGSLTSKEVGTIRKLIYNSNYCSKELRGVIAIDVAKALVKEVGAGHTDSQIIAALTNNGFTKDTDLILQKYKALTPKVKPPKPNKNTIVDALNTLKSDVNIEKLLTYTNNPTVTRNQLESFLTAAIKKNKTYTDVYDDLVKIIKSHPEFDAKKWAKTEAKLNTAMKSGKYWPLVAVIILFGIGAGWWKWDPIKKFACNLFGNPQWFCGSEGNNLNSDDGALN